MTASSTRAVNRCGVDTDTSTPHMGNEQVTTLNLEVVQADTERNLLLVKGSVPGPNGGVVIVRNAVKGK